MKLNDEVEVQLKKEKSDVLNGQEIDKGMKRKKRWLMSTCKRGKSG